MNPEFEDFPLQYAQDAAIFMHRDVHFGGSFDVMIEYYQNENKGVNPEFELERILTLAKLEQTAQQNLAPVMLTGADTEKVARAKKAYKELRELYENKPQKIPLLIADLILSEETYPEKEIEALVKEKSAAVPALLELLRSETFHDPLFPGYGQAPILAAKTLGLIGDKRAIISLFESIGEEDFFDEDILLNALKEIGAPAKEFLLHVLHARPINQDNEKAAVALLPFNEDQEVAEVCFKILQDPSVRSKMPFANYLTLVCEGLKDEQLRKKFIELAKDPATPKSVVQDILAISRAWQIL